MALNKSNLERIAPSSFKDGKFKNNWKELLNSFAFGELSEGDMLLFSDGVSNISLFQNLLVEPRPIIIKQTTLNKIRVKHDIEFSQLKNLAEWFENTPLILESLNYKNSFVVFANTTDKLGNEIIVALHLNTEVGQKNFEITLDEIATVYGKENVDYFVENVFNLNKTIILNEKTRDWLLRTGVSFPQPLANLVELNITHPTKVCQENILQIKQQLNEHEAAQEVNEEPFDPDLEEAEAVAASDALAHGASGVGLDEPTI